MVKDPKRKRADFKEKRNVDSGVWMGSDESGADSLLPSEDASNWGDEFLKDTSNTTVTGGGADISVTDSGRWEAQGQPWMQRPGLKKVEEPREHQAARAIVNECLESGQDSVDLR
jgi:predicted metal-dependent phosphotriesterase family hydrolase